MRTLGTPRPFPCSENRRPDAPPGSSSKRAPSDHNVIGSNDTGFVRVGRYGLGMERADAISVESQS